MIPFAPRGFALTNNTRWFLALCVDGSFVARSSGAAIFASTEARLATLVAEKARGTTTNLPSDFAGWVTESAPAPRQEGFRPFGAQQTARAQASARQPAAAPPVSDLPRTPGETAATLSLCVTNAERCLAGEIGGDIVKYARSVDTALQHHQESVEFWSPTPTRFAGAQVSEALLARVAAFKAALAAVG